MDRKVSFAAIVVFAGCLSTAACSTEVLGTDSVDQGEDDDRFLVFEGEALAAVDADGVSAALETEPFERLAILWDAPTANAFALRTSADGEIWSDWSSPTINSSDEGAHTGNFDVAEAASFFQYRVLDPAAPPSFLAIEPKPVIPVPLWIGEGSLPDTADADDAALEVVPEPGTLQFTVSTGIGNLTIHPRSEWGARAPRCMSSTTPSRATIHHTVTPTSDSLSVGARLRQIQAFHMFSNGWCDIGYNFLVSRDGRVWRGRGSQVLGAHVGDSNSGNVGVSFLGTYTSTSISSTQKCNAAKLLRWLHGRFPGLQLDRSDVKGHRQYSATACPGGALYNQLDGIVKTARNGC